MPDHRIDPQGIRAVDTSDGKLPDGQYGVAVVDGIIVGFEPIVPASQMEPWTTSTSSGPELMWDDDDNLMMVEVSA